MTTTQREQLERAIERVTKASLEVVGHGHRKCDNARIFAVPSQTEPNRWHIVTLVGSRLVCDCQSRVICAHRAAVHMEIVVQAAERELRSAEIERELAGESAEPSEPRPALNRSPRPRTDTRTFDIFAPEDTRRGAVAIARETM